MTLADFIRWSRDLVVERPAVANYHLYIDGEDWYRRVGDLQVSHDNEEITFTREDEDGDAPDEDDDALPG